MTEINGGVVPRGMKVADLAEAATVDLDVSKVGNIVQMTITGACVVTLINAPLGYSEVIFILTNPHTNFDIANCLWAGGTKTLTQTGKDYLKIGIICSAIGSGGAITGTIFEAEKKLALAAD